MNQVSSKRPKQRRTAASSIAAALTVLFVLVYSGPLPPAQAAEAAPRVANPIKHIVIMVKENRTFDDLFGTFPGADGATTYIGSDGKRHPLNAQPDLINDIDHSHGAFLTAYDNGKMDGFSKILDAIQLVGSIRLDMADSQLHQAEIPNYWKYAQTFTLSDHTFYTIQGPSFPNHLFSIAADDDNIDANPTNNFPYQQRWGCDSPQGTTVEERAPNGNTSNVFPCLDIPTLGDLLTSHGISWKYYAPAQDQPGYEWSTYDAIKDIRNTSQWQTHVVDYSQFATDAASGNLPTVSWLVQPTKDSDHLGNSICVGENWTVQQMNAIMGNSPLWDSTAIFLTWDDFGGEYDHVKPPLGPNGQIEYGFRAPMLIISPYAKPHYIDHTFYTFSSMLKFAETVLKLPSLGGLDTNSNDMFNAFNFSQQPLPPLILPQITCPPGSNQSRLMLDPS
jgi:phospholipase C